MTDAEATFLRAMFGPGPREADGPPYVHVHRLPESDEEMAAAPEWPSFSIERDETSVRPRTRQEPRRASPLRAKSADP